MKRLLILLLVLAWSPVHAARLFNDAATEYLTYSGVVDGTYAMSYAAWVRSDDVTIDQTLVSVGTSGSLNNRHLIQLAGTVASDPIVASTRTTPSGTATSSTGTTVNVWAHAAGVFTSATSRTAYVNGGSSGTNATNLTPTGMDTTRIGAGPLPNAYMSGRIAEAAIWDGSLTAADVASLADGFSPLLIRPAVLVAYWPLVGNASTEPDHVGGFGMTPTGTTKADHPRVYHAD